LEGGKKIIFVAPKVALVDQQADVLKKYIPFTVGAYNGYMQVDSWSREKWTLELSEKQARLIYKIAKLKLI